MSLNQGVICLPYLNETGYCFNVDDYMKIREQYRICGSLVGTCNTRGWAPDTKGLPAEFNLYETKFLVQKGYVCLISKQLTDSPSSDDKALYQMKIENLVTEQEEHLKEGKLNESKKCLDKIIAGKRKKLLEAGVQDKDIIVSHEQILHEIESSFKFDRENALLGIPNEHYLKYEGIVVDVPLNPSEKLKFDIFCNLWERGMYVTSGEAFGADFLAYPGDPLVFHASLIVIAIDDPKSVPTIDLIAKGRLAVIVNKSCVFAYYNKGSEDCQLDKCENNYNISYQVIHWEGCKDIIKTSKQPCDKMIAE